MTDSKLDRKLASLGAQLDARFGASIASQTIAHGELTVVVAAENILNVAEVLCRDDAFAFRQMSDLSGIDYLTYGQADWQTRAATDSGFSRGVSKASVSLADAAPERFAVIYQLLSVEHNLRLRLKVYLSEQSPRLPSVVNIWPGADWYEREAFDLFGILFESHPDLRRILTDYGFIGHPFRKDFPLEGHVEVRYDIEKQRVIYQPVTIENRVLVPRVIREENRPTANIEQSDSDA